jgi:hypothetical protein
MRFGLTICVLFIAFATAAQGNSWLAASGSHGFFIPHRESLPQLLTGHSQGFTLSYSRQVDGTSPWHHHFRGPERGISFLALDMGNREELGYIYSLYPYLDTHILPRGSQNGLGVRYGIGFSYLNKRFDREDNFFNQAIGSHINYSIVLGLRYRHVMNRLRIDAGISMSHASNATIQLPNLGVNVATADLRIAYRVNKEERPFELDKEQFWQKNKELWIGLAGGMRESNAFTHVKHPLQELRLTRYKRFSSKCTYLLGADITHNKASYQELDEPVGFGLDVMLVGLNAGIGLEFGRSRLFFQQGGYLLQGKQELGGLYHRIGGIWRVADRWAIELTMKTHFARADYLAVGFGYLLSEKNLQ